MKEHYFDFDRHKVPKGWNELEDWQLERICEALYTMEGDARDLRIIANLFGKEGNVLISESDARQLLAFINGESGRTKAIEPFKIGMFNVYGPGDRLNFSSFGEYIKAEAYFFDFLEKKSIESLDKLCATLYRSAPIFRLKAKGTDWRKPFDSNFVEADAERWKSVPLGKKLAIASFFNGSKDAIARVFPKIFKKPRKSATQEPRDKAIWLKSLSRLADGLQNYDVILNSRLTLVFFEISRVLDDHEKMKEEFERKKK